MVGITRKLACFLLERDYCHCLLARVRRDHGVSTFNWNEAVTMVPLKRLSPSQRMSAKPRPHLLTLSRRARAMAFPSAGNHMCCYVMVHICACDAARRKSRAERRSRLLTASVCVSVRELHPGRLWESALPAVFAAGTLISSSPLSHVLFFSPSEINLTELKFKCCSLRRGAARRP